MSPTAPSPRRVLIVDDSASVRRALSTILDDDPALSVMGTVADPFEAARLLRLEAPDVIVLDVEMPRMDGLTFLRRLMAQHPIPVVMCSTLMSDGARLAEALEAGAVDAIAKPCADGAGFPPETLTQIRDAVRAASLARRLPSVPASRTAPRGTAIYRGLRHGAPARAISARTAARQSLVAVGASTGGTEALRRFLSRLPADAPPVAVVQHMPAGFTAAFARRLDALVAVSVAEATEGDRLLPGQALIAPGGRHMVVEADGAGWRVALSDGPLVSRHRPSVDLLFHSVAAVAGRRAIGVIMTGMGDDGADGLLAMRRAGARTLGQDEGSCVVYGMPREAYARDAVEREADPEGLAEAVMGTVTTADRVAG